MALYTDYTDEQLVALLQSSDEGAFAEIYERYWEHLVDTGYYFTKDKQAVEEIVNDVFLRLWTRPAEFQIRSLKDYLGTAVKYGVFKALLKEKRRKALLKGMPGPILTADEEDRIDARFTHAYINGILDALPEKSRLIFRYSREQGLSTPEIAREMDMQPKAVEYHISKTLKHLRGVLADTDPTALILFISIFLAGKK